jgi:hypothetical protein
MDKPEQFWKDEFIDIYLDIISENSQKFYWFDHTFKHTKAFILNETKFNE